MTSQWSPTYHLEGALVSLLLVVRPQPRRPTRARNRQVVQDRQGEVPRVGQRMDEEVRHVDSRVGFQFAFTSLSVTLNIYYWSF